MLKRLVILILSTILLCSFVFALDTIDVLQPGVSWKMNESSGNLVCSKTGMELVPTGSPTYGATGLYDGGAVTFSGSGQWFTIASGSQVGKVLYSDSFTKCFDLKPDAKAQNKGIASYGPYASNLWYAAYTAYMQLPTVTATGGQVIPTDRWGRFCWTKNDTHLVAYNNADVVMATPTTFTLGTTAQTFYLGWYYSNSYPWAGEIGCVRMWNVSLNSSQILAINTSCEYITGGGPPVDTCEDNDMLLDDACVVTDCSVFDASAITLTGSGTAEFQCVHPYGFALIPDSVDGTNSLWINGG